jgi:hypothetical protein
MGVFDTAAKKIIDLLGMTTLGQKTKATALGVTLASDEDAIAVVDDGGSLTVDSPGIPTSIGQKTKTASLAVTLASDENALAVTVAAGSDVTEGNTSDAAVITDTTGTVSGKIRGLVKWAFERMPASLGQKAKAASLPVTLASDEDAIKVSDNAGSLTVDSPQLPSALGKQAVAASLSVVQATEEAFALSAKATWAIYRGAILIADGWDGSKGVGAGGGFNIYAVRGTEGNGVLVDTIGEIQEYFKGDHANMNGDPIWIFIPLVAEGYSAFWLNIRNDLGVDLVVTLYGALDNGVLFSSGGDPERQVTDALGSLQIATATIATGAVDNFSNCDDTTVSKILWPFNWLILKVDPSADPSTGAWSLGIVLSS